MFLFSQLPIVHPHEWDGCCSRVLGWMCHFSVSYPGSYVVQANILHNVTNNKKKVLGLGFFPAFLEHLFAGYLLGRIRLGGESVRG